MINGLVFLCLYFLGTVCLLLIAIFALGLMITKWHYLSIRLRTSFILLIGGQVILLFLLAYIYWPYSTPGLSQREILANEFMTDLSEGRYEKALAKITEAPPDEYHGIRNDFSDPNNWPTAWELENPNTRAIFGKATFPDAEELEIVLFLEWEWEKARWGIYGVEFGRDIYEGKIRFWLHDTFLPYTWFAWSVVIASIICIYFSVRQIRKVLIVPKQTEHFA